VSTSTRFGDTWASVILDLLRGIAALLVFGEHWRNFFFVDFPELTVSQRWAYALPYTLTAAGHQAVVVFFLLSGFLISGSVFRMLDHDRWTWRGYATHRLLRLWIVLVPGLLLCAMWDSFGVSLLATRALYFGDAANHLMHDVAYQRRASYFFGNLLFLQGKTVPTFGSNVALWSLANEFWYYVLFPLALIATWKSQRIITRVVCGLLFVAICSWLRGSFLPVFPIWLAGVLVFRLPRIPLSTRARWLAVALYVPIVLAPTVFRLHINVLLSDYLLTVATGSLLWVLLSATSKAENSRTVSAIRFLARGSFSLYVVHVPVFAFFAAYFVGNDRWQPTMVHLLVGGAVFAGTAIYAFIIAYFTEFRTDTVRRWLERNYPTITGAQRAL
jgi:peptidoglycan/LPS O-acetylase OafA/YrhL